MTIITTTLISAELMPVNVLFCS